MNEYYAVVRSTDHLAHYGIRGMKWGVRKAVDRGDARALSKQYKKAQKKLAKLNAQADIRTQEKQIKKHNRRALGALGVSLAGMGVATGNRMITNNAAKNFASIAAKKIGAPIDEIVHKTARKKRIVGEGKGIHKVGEGLGLGPVGDNSGGLKAAVNGGGSSTKSKPSTYKIVDKVAKGAVLAGLGAAAYQGGRSLAAKYRTTQKGHAKAVAKRDAFAKELNQTFMNAYNELRRKNKLGRNRRS